MKLHAEIDALAKILDVAESTDQIPADWRSILKDSRKTLVYRNISEQLEPRFKRIEQASDEAEMNELIETIPCVQFTGEKPIFSSNRCCAK